MSTNPDDRRADGGSSQPAQPSSSSTAAATAASTSNSSANHNSSSAAAQLSSLSSQPSNSSSSSASSAAAQQGQVSAVPGRPTAVASRQVIAGITAKPPPSSERSAHGAAVAHNNSNVLPGSSSTGIQQEKVTLKANGVCYIPERVIGNGSFGVVFQAQVAESKEVVAIKKVLQDKRFKNRELQIMRALDHPNVVALKNSFYTTGEKPDEVFLNLVLEYIPDTVYRIARNYSKAKQVMPILLVKLYTYQLARALGYIHSNGICHRDIKPQNLLLDHNTGVLKLCDFGSAKILVRGEPNVAYICSRYYRAPELIFGSTNYTTTIDVWSLGCVMAELLLGQPLFPGESGVDQLVEIIKVLGTPSREQIEQMNQNYTEFKFPQIKAHPWSKVFRPRTSPEAIDLIVHLLNYAPTSRLKPLEACAHPFFDELRDPNTRLPSGRPLPPLFNFSPREIKSMLHLGLDPHRLIPKHSRCELTPAALELLDQVPPSGSGSSSASTSGSTSPGSLSSSGSTVSSSPSAAAAGPTAGGGSSAGAPTESTDQATRAV